MPAHQPTAPTPTLPQRHAARRTALLAAPLATLLALHSPGAQADVLYVGPGQTYTRIADAIAKAQDGDTIRVASGTYTGDVALIHQRQLTIEGVGERPVLAAGGRSSEGKAIWVIRNGNITVRNIEFRGARVPDDNGAGIRFERGSLLLQRCRFVDNQNGILTANYEDADLRIEDSEFSGAARDGGQLHHLLYVGRIGRFEVRGSRFHGGYQAHLIKSRARVSRIAYNLIYDGPGGEAAYEVDLPNGGDAELVGNVIGQSAGTSNPVVVSYGAEGGAWPSSRLLMSHNTLISDKVGAWFLRSYTDKLPPDTPLRAVNNLTVGIGVFTLGAPGHFDGNLPATAGMLEAPELLDFALKRDSLLRGRAQDPRSLAGEAALPTAEFTLPIGTRPLLAPADWSPGALQR